MCDQSTDDTDYIAFKQGRIKIYVDLGLRMDAPIVGVGCRGGSSVPHYGGVCECPSPETFYFCVS